MLAVIVSLTPSRESLVSGPPVGSLEETIQIYVMALLKTGYEYTYFDALTDKCVSCLIP